MGYLSLLKYTFIIFAAHLATSCGAPFEIHCSKRYSLLVTYQCQMIKVWNKITYMYQQNVRIL
jgi:hypothetical protein